MSLASEEVLAHLIGSGVVTPDFNSLACSTEATESVSQTSPPSPPPQPKTPSAAAAEIVEVFPLKRKRGLIAHDESLASPKRKRFELGTPVFVCHNPANPFARAAALSDACESIFACKEKNCIQLSGVLATLFANSDSVALGEGVNGCVWRVDLCERRFALKTLLAKRPLRLLLRSPGDMKQLAAESRIAAFMTRRMLNIDNATLARCPNFAGIYAYELSSRVPHRRSGSQNLFRKQLRGAVACVSAHEVFVLGNATMLRFSALGTGLVDRNPLTSEQLAFSLIGQILVAICCMSAVGVSHNDLALTNVIARPMPETANIVYEFPPLSTLNTPGGRRRKFALNTQGVLFAVCDFGIASCSRWETSGDARFASAPSGIGRHAIMGSTFYEPEERNVKRRDGLLLLDEKGASCHPLRCDVDTLERDVAFFLNNVIWHASRFEESHRVEKFARAALREFDVVGRLQTAAQLADIVQHVLSFDFAARHFNAARAAEFFADVDTLPPYTHVYRLPDADEGAYLERELECLLNAAVRPNSLMRVVERIEFEL